MSGFSDPLRLRVSTHDEIRTALLRAADQARPAELWSAPGAACWLGPRWLRLAVSHVAAALPAPPVWTCVLDCGDAPGLALAAWADGQTAVALSGTVPAPAWARMQAIATQSGTVLLRAEDGPADSFA
ncbi:hypothetical protein [Novispirillum itersonii]|uniref:hypothetical protein n=1 Tax=Novispirillum itersonii TaxID=189 RepID=UPI00037A2D6D|nr:hypothetical protein [Novispirillum itersonii]